MEYSFNVLIDEELELIQNIALKFRLVKNPLHNDIEIRKLIKEYGYRYMEDFVKDEYLEKITESDTFEDLDDEPYTKYIEETNSLKNTVQIIITDDFVDYEYLYKLRGVNIKPRDWDLLFNVMYDFYRFHDFRELFLDDMSRLNRLAFSLALLKNSIIDINYYIDGLGYLESRYLKKNDILNLQDKLTRKTNSKNIVNSNNYSNKNNCKVKTKHFSENKIIDFNRYRKSHMK